MPQHFAIIRVSVLAGILLASAPAYSKEYALYYLGGQSNMDGYGYTKDLSDDLKKPIESVLIFHGNLEKDGDPAKGLGVWAPLEPGHGTGFATDGKSNNYSDRFGSELSFGHWIKELHPDTPIAIFKYSRGGTSISHKTASPNNGCWDPDFSGGEGEGKGVNQYDHFLASLRNALAVRDIDGDGEEDVLKPMGIAWMQGESDALDAEEVAQSYQANLTRLMNLIRAALRIDDLPVVIGRITDSGRITGKWMMKHYDTVRAAQQAFVEADGNAALVTSTDNYLFSDDWHYDSAAYLDLGRQFADALTALQKK